MKYNVQPEEFFSLVSSLINDLHDFHIVKYKRKLVNSYINTTIKLVHNQENPLPLKFILTICMHSLVQQVEQDAQDILPKEIREKIEKELITYLCMQEISKIRAIIIDLYSGTYTEEKNYSVKPEEWAVKVVAELKTLIPSGKKESFKESKKFVLEILQDLLAKELKEAFLSRSKKFGKKGNQLIINVLYIEKYFKEYTSLKSMSTLIKDIQENFKEKEAVASAEDLARFIK